MRTLFRYHLLPLLAYTVIALVVLWPLPTHPTTAIAGAGDGPWFLWQLWWFKRAIFDLNVTPLVTDRIFFPLTNVAVQWQTPYNEALMTPLLFGTSLTLHYNILVVATYALSGYGTYLLTAALTRNRTAAFAGGLLFAFCGYRNVRALGHLSLLTTQWIPFLALAGMQAWRRPGVKTGVVLGVMAALVALSSPYYIGMVMLPMALAGGLYVLITQRRRLLRTDLLWAGGAAAFVLLLATLPFYLDYLRLDPEIYALTRTLNREGETMSADVLSYVVPPERNPIWGRWTRPIYKSLASPNAAETTLFVGLAVIVLAAASIFMLRRLPRSALFWQLLALITTLLSFGPTLRFGGQTILPWMPFRLFAQIPGFYSFRIPSRFGITAALALIVLAAYVVVYLMRGWSARTQAIAVFVGAMVITINMLYAWPFVSTSTRIPVWNETIRAQAGDRAVLSLPAGEYFTETSGFDFYGWVGRSMYEQTLHGKPLVSGYLGRRPDRLYEFERNALFLRRFFSRDPHHPVIDLPPVEALPVGYWPADIRFGNDLLYGYGIDNVVLRCEPLGDLCRPAYSMLRQSLGLPWHEEDGVLLFHTATPHMDTLPDLLATAAITASANLTPTLHDAFSRTRIVGPAASVQATAPLAGNWRIQGDLVGDTTADFTLAVDGEPIPLRTMPVQTPRPATLFEADVPLETGDHTVEFAGGRVPAADEDACAHLCLSNLSITLVEPETPVAEPQVTFTDDKGRLVSLQEARIVETEASPFTDTPRTWLITQWMAAGSDAETLLTASEDNAPSLFVHLTDEEGATLAQADHRFGERRAWGPEPSTFLDVVELPPEFAASDLSQIRLGLWYPESESYFWATEPARVDDGQRFVLKRDALPVQSVRIPEPDPDPLRHARFTREGVPIAFELLDAYVTAGGPFSCLQLVTTWQTEGYDLSDAYPPTGEPAQLTAHFTDEDGAILAGSDQAFAKYDATLLAGDRLLITLDVPCEMTLERNPEVRLLVWNPDIGERYAVETDALLDGEKRLRLGTLSELMR